jgi:hypothetical protein
MEAVTGAAGAFDGAAGHPRNPTLPRRVARQQRRAFQEHRQRGEGREHGEVDAVRAMSAELELPGNQVPVIGLL